MLCQQYNFPDDELIYGQSFLCLTLDITQLEIVASQLMIAHPQIYESRVPAAVAAKAPSIAKLVNGVHGDFDSNVAEIKTLLGLPFKTYYKDKAWNSDLYGKWVAPTIKCNMIAETWMISFTQSLCPLFPSFPVFSLDSIPLFFVSLD